MGTGRGCVLALAAAVAVLILGVQLLIAILDGSADASCGAPVGAATQPRPSKDADAIPSNYLAIYRATGPHYGIPWTVLAGIGKVETDHGTSTLPGVRSGENFAGAGGPMQFLKATWDAYGVDGDHDNKKDRYNPADAIPGAANYLKHNGADRGGQKLRRAIWHYNHSWDYVDLVLRWAQRYADGHFTVGDHNTPEASCAAGFGQGGNWPPGSACPGGGALGAGHITARMRCVRDQIKAMFTIPHGIGCYRPNGGIPGGGEHPVGRACDFMISSGQPTAQEAQLGYDIANWVKSNAKRLGIYYIIYRQHIWNPARAREGWRLMEDRGSVTANHYDHVHVSVDG